MTTGERSKAITQRSAHTTGLALRALAAIALAWACVLALGAPCAVAAQSSADAVVWQKLQTDQLNGVDKTYDYRLEAITPGAPMPDGSVDGVYAWQMTSDERTTLTIPFDTPLSGVCEYRMYQLVTEPKDHYTYDDAVYIVRLHPLGGAAEGAMLIVYDAQGELKEPDPGWTVSYESGPAAGDGDDPDAPQTVPQIVSSLAKTADALDITVFALFAAGAAVGVGVSARKRPRGAERAGKRGRP